MKRKNRISVLISAECFDFLKSEQTPYETMSEVAIRVAGDSHLSLVSSSPHVAGVSACGDSHPVNAIVPAKTFVAGDSHLGPKSEAGK